MIEDFCTKQKSDNSDANDSPLTNMNGESSTAAADNTTTSLQQRDADTVIDMSTDNIPVPSDADLSDSNLETTALLAADWQTLYCTNSGLVFYSN